MTRARIVRWSFVLAAVAGLLVVALRPEARLVDTATIDRGEVEQAFEAEGRTRVRDRYLLSAPVAAQARRLLLQPGDRVEVGDPLVVLDPLPAAALDPRSREQAASALQAAEARRRTAQQSLQAAETVAAQARADADRLRRLAERELLAADQAERASRALQQAEREVAAARFRVATAAHERDAAQAVLSVGSDRVDGAPALTLTSPVAGVLLQRHYESAQPVTAGQPLLEVGDPTELEVEVDVLSADAVRLRPGMTVQLLRWGGQPALDGHVVRIEPGGFTRLSALGVEEQRVWTIVAIDTPVEHRRSLGDRYRVDARFVLDRRRDVVRVPSSALFQVGDGWQVFGIERGRVEPTAVVRGLDGGMWVEVVDGLSPGDRVVVHPDRGLNAGERIRQR